jgi:hypothetical protein
VTSAASSDPAHHAAPTPPRPWYADGRVFVFLLVVTALTRAFSFGNPVLYNDEQFYLLVGSRMLEGALPYVDLWDRKPIGLFFIYAATSALGPWDVLQYQATACLFAGTTAWVIYRIARMIACAHGALIAAACYPLYLAGFSLVGGQAPVFYNLFVALTAWWLARRYRDGNVRKLFFGGCLAMLALGSAMQVKYTVVFEGVYFGLALLWLAHRVGLHRWSILPMAAGWVGCALVPTALALGWYASQGDMEAYFYANFISIFERESGISGPLIRLPILLFFLTPLWLLILWAPQKLGLKYTGLPVLDFVTGWAIAAFAGFMIIGTYYDHYVGPLLVPFFVLGSRALGLTGLRRKLAIGVIVFGIACTILHTAIRVEIDGSKEEFAAVREAVAGNLAEGDCLYVYEGDVALYHATGACTVTPYVFPTHLNSFKEEYALGIDTGAEMERIVAARPKVIVKMAEPYNDPDNAGTRAVLEEALAAGYGRTATLPRGTREVEIWVRR